MGETKFDTVFDDNKDSGRSPSSEGFSASMSGLNLFDIVQLECFSRAERAIRITSGHQIGYLFFANGALTHALTPDAHGDSAALQILNWHDGSLEQCSLEPDEGSRVKLPWQELLLRAAQTADESKRNVVEFPRPRGHSSGPARGRPAPPVSQRPHAETSKPARDGVIGAARVHPSGEILSSRGEVGAELAGLAAYVARLADLVGEFFGTGRVRAIDARMAQTRSVVKRESDASITTVLASTSQSQAQELTSHAIDWGLPEPTVVHLLSGLRDVEGVVGSFLVAPSGASIGVDLPQVFDADVVAEATDRLTRARDGFEARGDRLRSLELRFAQQRLYLTCIDAGFLGVLHVGPANVPLLSMATQVVLRKLSAPPGTIPSRLGTSATVTPPAEPRTATAATPRPKPRANSVPGAPAAGGGRPKRPVYFRGRLVNSD